MDDQTPVYSDAHVSVFRQGDEALGHREVGAAFYRIQAGELEFTYDVGAQAWYVRLPGREQRIGPVMTDTYFESVQDSTMVNIDWDRAGSRVLGIEIIGGSSRGKRVVIEVPDAGRDLSLARDSHLHVVPPTGAERGRSAHNLIRLADTLAEQWHGDQLGKDGRPYVEHPRTVASIVASERGRTFAQEWNVDLETAQVVALLHDLLEDTSISSGEMEEAGLPAEVIEVVQLLTKPKGED